MLTPASGDISYKGSTIVGSPPYELNRLGIAMVPEGRLIFPSLSVEENLKIGGYAGRSGRWSLDEINDLFPPLKDLRSIGGTDLSGGQQQMSSWSSRMWPAA